MQRHHSRPARLFRSLMDSLEQRMLLSAALQPRELDEPFPAILTDSAPAAAAPAGPVAAAFPADPTNLHSNPSASQKIYLDFDGEDVTGTWWNDNQYPTIHAPPFDLDGNWSSFSDAELSRITEIWQYVSEAFSPFGVDVTTQRPASFGGTNAQQVIISTDRDAVTGGNWVGGTYGGWAYYNTWSGSAQPCWVFYNNLGNGYTKYVGDASVHETGHTLGLRHDGTTTGTEYYEGQGTGEVGWAPIMGVGYYRNLVQWSKGEYTKANNTEDDLAIIASTTNRISYRADDFGNTLATAGDVTLSGNSISATGIITTRTDVDFVKFTTDPGTITLQVLPAARGAMMDIRADLYDSNGNLLASSNPDLGISASISLTLSVTGTYYVKIDGVGRSSPLTDGYSDYGSIGTFRLSGTIVPPAGSLAAPTNLAATTVSTSQINLAWQDNSSEDSFVVQRSSDGGQTFTQIGTTSANVNSYADQTAAAGATYIYRVFAQAGATISNFSNTASATALCQAPASASATALSATQIRVDWSAVSGAASFRIERSATGTGGWTQIGTAISTATSYTDGTVSANTTYYYQVKAVNAAGQASAPSPVASATTPQSQLPAAPTNLRTTAATKNSITLAWTDNANNESGFRVERLNGSTWTTVATLGTNVQTYKVNGLKRNTSYTFRVAAYNAAGSAYSNTLATSTTRSLPVGANTINAPAIAAAKQDDDLRDLLA